MSAAGGGAGCDLIVELTVRDLRARVWATFVSTLRAEAARVRAGDMGWTRPWLQQQPAALPADWC